MTVSRRALLGIRAKPMKVRPTRQSRMAAESIRTLTEHISQRRLERDVLGLSQGYLSRIAAGKGNPSLALVALLSLLAREPHHLKTIRRLWTERTNTKEARR